METVSPVLYDSLGSFVSSASSQLAWVIVPALGLLGTIVIVRFIIKSLNSITGITNEVTPPTPQTYFGGVGHRYSNTVQRF